MPRVRRANVPSLHRSDHSSGRPVFTRGRLRMYCTNQRSEDDAVTADRWHIEYEDQGHCLAWGSTREMPDSVRGWHFMVHGRWEPDAAGYFEPPPDPNAPKVPPLTSAGFTASPDFNGEWRPTNSKYSGQPIYRMGQLCLYHCDPRSQVCSIQPAVHNRVPPPTLRERRPRNGCNECVFNLGVGGL